MEQIIQNTPRRNFLNQSRSYMSIRPNIGRRNNIMQEQNSQLINDNEQCQINQQRGIYGTNILTSQVQGQFQRFIKQFTVLTNQQGLEQDMLQQQKYYYFNQLKNADLDLLQNNLFEINGKHVKQFDTQLYYKMIYFPAQMITLFDQVIKKIYLQQYIDKQFNQKKIQQKLKKKQQLMVSIKNIQSIIKMRNLSQKYINRLVSYRGIIIRCSDVYPQMKTAVFRCYNPRCRAQVQVLLQNAKVQQPLKCLNCQTSESYQIIHNYCNFTDKQYIKIQQLPQNVTQGQTPSSVNILCYDSNVNSMRPGDRVQIVGIYRCQGRKISRTRLGVQTVFSTYTDLISVKIIQENRFKASLDDKKTPFTQEQRQQFFNLANQPSIIDKLVQSFSPSIYSHQNVKKGLLAQIFGGTNKSFQGRGRFRSDINICMVGDPSTAKSQLLKQVYQIAPRGIYTSGKGSSAVGLTANVRKDPETRQFVLESGALVLSDLGICCIDQFDKMDANSKLVLLQAMEQQTISVAKAGIVCQLNSRTSILAAANPILSKYDPKRSVIQNISLPPALLSRFDLIYIILDIPNKKLDMKLAQHILAFYTGKQNIKQQNGQKIPQSFLAKYITFARQCIHPKITPQAGQKLSIFYNQMRKLGSGTKTVTATVRQLESMIRISQAFAKMRLSKLVQQKDVLMAYDLIQQALKQSATDPTTGLIDMDVIVTGHSSASRSRVQSYVSIIRSILNANATEYSKKTPFDRIYEQVNKRYYQINGTKQIVPRQQQIVQALSKLQQSNQILLFGNDKRHRPQFRKKNQIQL